MGRFVFRRGYDEGVAKPESYPHLSAADHSEERTMKRTFALLMLCVAALSLSGCGYNTLQSSDEQIKASWAEVVNQYQRRADLVPNLVNTVKGFAAQEEKVLIGVT